MLLIFDAHKNQLKVLLFNAVEDKCINSNWILQMNSYSHSNNLSFDFFISSYALPHKKPVNEPHYFSNIQFNRFINQIIDRMQFTLFIAHAFIKYNINFYSNNVHFLNFRFFSLL